MVKTCLPHKTCCHEEPNPHKEIREERHRRREVCVPGNNMPMVAVGGRREGCLQHAMLSPVCCKQKCQLLKGGGEGGQVRQNRPKASVEMMNMRGEHTYRREGSLINYMESSGCSRCYARPRWRFWLSCQSPSSVRYGEAAIRATPRSACT